MTDRFPPIHPGEILLEEFLKPMELSQYRLAKSVNVSPRRINEIVQRKRVISADTALRLGRYFGRRLRSGSTSKPAMTLRLRRTP